MKIEESWKIRLGDEFAKSYFRDLRMFILKELTHGKVIYPNGSQMFAAFDQTPFDNVKVVILGQDPYHGEGQANGLCFSVNDGVKIPPSLQNIFKEIQDELGTTPPESGNLERWAKQGVLLLNSTLTVRENEPGSHQHQGWEIFTDEVIKIISSEKEHVVFMLWGKYAQSKEPLIDGSKHLILKAAHPSPFSAYNGFFGCDHFLNANVYLSRQGIEPINW